MSNMMFTEFDDWNRMVSIMLRKVRVFMKREITLLSMSAVACTVMLLSGCGKTVPTSTRSAAVENNNETPSTANTFVSNTSTNDNSSAAKTNTESNSTSTSSSNQVTNTTASNDTQTTKHYIPGLNLEDIRLGLQQTWGLTFNMSSGANGTMLYTGEAVDPDTGADLKCTIYFDSVTQVIQIECSVDGGSVSGLESASAIDQVASGFLGYCATAPYANANGSETRTWVQSVIQSSSKSATKDISGVRFNVMNTTWVKTLNISNMDFGTSPGDYN